MKSKLIATILVAITIVNTLMGVKVLAHEQDLEHFKTLSIDEGLSNDNITSIFQDNKGYMWIGTSDGLNRYDGKNIKIYNCDINNPNSLSSTEINALAQDSYGNIWIGTSSGLDILNTDKDSIIKLESIKLDEYEEGYTLGNTKITSLLYSKYEENIMWVGTENGLLKIDTKSLECKDLYTDKDNKNSLTNSYITCLEEDKNGILWIGTKYGLNGLNSDLNSIYNKFKSFDNTAYIYNIEQDKTGDIWISTKYGILLYNREGEFLKDSYNKNNIEYMYNNRFILSDSNNHIWLSSSNGLGKYSLDTTKYKVIKHNSNIKDSISSNYITCLYEDRNKVIWVGTDKGVNILNNHTQLHSSYDVNEENRYLYDKDIVSIVEDNEYVYVATKSNGLYVYDKYENLKKHLYEINDEVTLEDKIIKNLFKIEDSYIVISTNKDIISIDTQTFELKTYSLEEPLELVYMYSDGELIWILDTNNFYTYNIKTKKRTYHNDKLIYFNIKTGDITYILPDKNDNNILWLGGNDTGLVKYHKENGIIKIYKHDDSNNNSLIHNYINCMAFDSYGDLWIGTNIGLSKLNIKTEKFTSYNVASGLTNNYIKSILIDDNKNIWISTNKGLSQFDIKEENFINYTQVDGLYGYQFNLNSALKHSSGNLLFGSTKGIAYFSQDETHYHEPYDEKVVIGDIYIGKDKVIYDGKELVLTYNDRDLSINYFLPIYSNLNNVSYLDNVTYEYLIEGFDSEWKYVGDNSCIDIKFLKSGKYTLKIRARDVHGNLTDETHMDIRVKKPIYNNLFSNIIYISILALVVYYIINYVKILHCLVDQKTMHLNNQLKENKRLSEEIIDKEKLKNNYFVNLSHELRTPINIISSTVQLINAFNKDKLMTEEKSLEYMNIISKSCNNLLKIIGDIIDTSKIETGQYKISKSNNDIVYVVEEVALNMSKYIEKKGLSLIIDPDIEEKIISFDSTEIERCVINLLGNAVKFTPEGGEIRVYIKEVKGYIEIIVEDTGIGISKEDQDFIFNRFSQVEGNGATKSSSSGIGLTLVKYISELHGGYVNLESEFGKGSKFTIGIPDVVEDTLQKICK